MRDQVQENLTQDCSEVKQAPEHVDTVGDDSSEVQIEAEDMEMDNNNEIVERQTTINEPFSIFTVPQKRMIVITGSFAAFFSPLASNIYFPALDTIAQALNVSNTQINLSVTTYIILQGIAPMMVAGFSDKAGRRPAYCICFVIFIFSNIGLGLQNSYAALMALRCIQSAGSSGTVALGNGIVGDIITSSERGSYIAFAALGSMLGPSVSPIIGGLLSQYAGWHWIFWFLVIISTAFFIPLALFLPETCRNVVCDGSVPPPKLSMSITDMIRHRNRVKSGKTVDPEKLEMVRKNYKLRVPNPLTMLVVLGDKETALILIVVGFAMACYNAVATGMASQFIEVYGYNDMQISFMFIPIGVGGIASALSTGKIVDWNFKRHCRLRGVAFVRNRRQDISNFPIEKARIEVALPFMFFGGISVISYGWMMTKKINIAGPGIILFIMGYTMIAAYQVLNVLIVDIYPGKPATAVAMNNFVRCSLTAASSAIIAPLLNAVGSGWAYTILSLILIMFLPSLILLMKNGIKWRAEAKLTQKKRSLKAERKKQARAEKKEKRKAEKESKKVEKQQRLAEEGEIFALQSSSTIST